jgi:hypothetical protein
MMHTYCRTAALGQELNNVSVEPNNSPTDVASQRCHHEQCTRTVAPLLLAENMVFCQWN